MKRPQYIKASKNATNKQKAQRHELVRKKSINPQLSKSIRNWNVIVDP